MRFIRRTRWPHLSPLTDSSMTADGAGSRWPIPFRCRGYKKDFTQPLKELLSYDPSLFQAGDWHFQVQHAIFACSSLNCRVSLLECFLNPVEQSPEAIRNYPGLAATLSSSRCWKSPGLYRHIQNKLPTPTEHEQAKLPFLCLRSFLYSGFAESHSKTQGQWMPILKPPVLFSSIQADC